MKLGSIWNEMVYWAAESNKDFFRDIKQEPAIYGLYIEMRF